MVAACIAINSIPSPPRKFAPSTGAKRSRREFLPSCRSLPTAMSPVSLLARASRAAVPTARAYASQAAMQPDQVLECSSQFLLHLSRTTIRASVEQDTDGCCSRKSIQSVRLVRRPQGRVYHAHGGRGGHHVSQRPTGLISPPPAPILAGRSGAAVDRSASTDGGAGRPRASTARRSSRRGSSRRTETSVSAAIDWGRWPTDFPQTTTARSCARWCVQPDWLEPADRCRASSDSSVLRSTDTAVPAYVLSGPWTR